MFLIQPKRKAKLYLYKGKKLTIKQLSDLPECNVTYEKLRVLISSRKLSVEDSVNYKPERKGSFFYKGEYYTSRELSEHPDCKVCHGTLIGRIRCGDTIENAMKPLKYKKSGDASYFSVKSELNEHNRNASKPECYATVRYRI